MAKAEKAKRVEAAAEKEREDHEAILLSIAQSAEERLKLEKQKEELAHTQRLAEKVAQEKVAQDQANLLKKRANQAAKRAQRALRDEGVGAAAAAAGEAEDEGVGAAGEAEDEGAGDESSDELGAAEAAAEDEGAAVAHGDLLTHPNIREQAVPGDNFCGDYSCFYSLGIYEGDARTPSCVSQPLPCHLAHLLCPCLYCRTTNTQTSPATAGCQRGSRYMISE